MLLDFHRGNLATIPNTIGKHRSRPHPFRNQTSKPNTFKALKANANSLFSTANFLKLWFYKNKGLSLDRCCGVPNTFRYPIMATLTRLSSTSASVREMMVWRCVASGVWLEYESILWKLPRVSEVATNHWVFLGVIGHLTLWFEFCL